MTTTISMRVPAADLEQIDERAAKVGMSRTAYVLRSVLGRATVEERRLAEVEERIGRLEGALFEP